MQKLSSDLIRSSVVQLWFHSSSWRHSVPTWPTAPVPPK